MRQNRTQLLQLPGGATLALDRPVIVGILNVTPDSFSDGGRYFDAAAAAGHALKMIDQGADAIDIGGESTRPGAAAVSPDEQIRRVVGVIRQIKSRHDVAISIDTRSAEVAAAALAAGAGIINDVSAGSDPAMFPLAARSGAAVILMHMRGTPATMQQQTVYGDVVAEVRDFLLARAAAAQAAGVDRQHIVIDPGLGFAKTSEHNLTLLAHLDALVATGYPVMLGTSRKAFLGLLAAQEKESSQKKGSDPFSDPDSFSAPPAAPAPPEERIWGTCATTALAVAAGVALLRVHDVLPNRRAADAAFAVARARRTTPLT